MITFVDNRLPWTNSKRQSSKNNNDRDRIVSFLRANIGNKVSDCVIFVVGMLLNIVCLAETKLSVDYHHPPILPIDTVISRHTLQLLDCLLEGIIDVDPNWQSISPQLLSTILMHYFNADKVSMIDCI